MGLVDLNKLPPSINYKVFNVLFWDTCVTVRVTLFGNQFKYKDILII